MIGKVAACFTLVSCLGGLEGKVSGQELTEKQPHACLNGKSQSPIDISLLTVVPADLLSLIGTNYATLTNQTDSQSNFISLEHGLLEFTHWTGGASKFNAF